MTHDSNQVAGDVGVAVPAETGVTTTADVDVCDPVTGRGQRRGEETVRVPAVTDPVRENDEGPCPVTS